MSRIGKPRLVVVWIALGLAGWSLLRGDAPGRAGFALERAVAASIDEQLPTQEQVDELARVNRLVARKALPAVVHIVTEERATALVPPDGFNPEWLEMLPQWRQIPEERRREWLEQHRRDQNPGTNEDRRVPTGQGSGVIINAAEGVILTNNHVVSEADGVKVRLLDGRRFEATVVGTDPPTDLAVIRIDAENLSELRIGDSNLLQVGDPVMTIGNPFGMEGTVSKGIVSALDRSQLGIMDYEGFIQTDAVINPGNSGGPLVNMRAEVVGINSAIETTTGSFNGIGLAIPSSRINRVLPALLKGEKVIRGYLGVAMGNIVDQPPKAKELGWSQPYGVRVDQVVPDSPAAEAGLAEDDILINLNGEPIHSTTSLTETVAYTPPGAVVVLDIWRNRHTVSVRITVGRQPTGFSTRITTPRQFREDRIEPIIPETPELSGQEQELSSLGLSASNLSSELARTYNLNDSKLHGPVVTKVAPGSQAGEQVQPGDVIVAVNGNTVKDVNDLLTQIERASDQPSVDLRLRNAKGSRHVKLPLAQ